MLMIVLRVVRLVTVGFSRLPVPAHVLARNICATAFLYRGRMQFLASTRQSFQVLRSVSECFLSHSFGADVTAV